MRKQRLLKIETPAGQKPLWASTFREMVAKGGDGSALLPPRFFHYGEDGRTLPGKPDIRIVGGHRWVGILSQSGDNALMDAALGTAIRLVGEHYNMPVPIRVEQPEFGVAPAGQGDSGGIFHYFLRDMAIKRRSDRRRALDTESLVKEVVLKGLGEIAETYGFDLPPDRALGLRIHELRTIGLRLSTVSGATNEYVTLVNASVSMRANLAGVWQVGHLQARGYGRIVPCRPGDALHRTPLEGKEVLR